MFKNIRLVIPFDMFLNPSFKMTTSFANIARTTPRTSKFIYKESFKPLGIGSSYEKQFLILNELKASFMLKFFLQNTLESCEIIFLIWYERLSIYGNLK